MRYRASHWRNLPVEALLGRGPAGNTRAAVVLGFAVLVQACGDPLKKPDLIEETRVIGARTEVENAPERAWPRPGETARVRWLVAHPDEPRPVSWVFELCPAVDVAYGVPQCAAAPFASAEQLELTHAEPSIEFDVPEEIADYGVDELAVLGVVCSEGTPRLADTLEASGCTDGEGQRVSFTFGVDLEDAGNLNPSIASAPLTLDGTEWGPAAEDSGCADLPQVEAGSKHTLELELTDADREEIEVEYDFDEPREALQVSHFVTSGDFSHAYTVIEGNQPNRVEVQWTAPKKVESPRIVRFYFVARDLRGGADWTQRTLCVMQ